MTDNLVLAVPSKGRLMEQTAEIFAAAGLTLEKNGNERGYRGAIANCPDAEVIFVSASEIAQKLKTGQVHLGVTGEDLVREEIIGSEKRIEILKRLGFGHADVVVAVPQCWVDVSRMTHLQAVAAEFRRVHSRRLRVATKYTNLTRAYFSRHGITDYRIVESLGATEGTPASGAAELIVDITTTGSTLKANGLKVLQDGPILYSEACLIASKAAEWTPSTRGARNEILARLES